METNADPSQLRHLLIQRLPEARQEFEVLSSNDTCYACLHMLYQVTAKFAGQNRIKDVKKCLLVAEDLLLEDEPKLSTAVCSVYVYRLALLLDERTDRSDVIHHILPQALAAEYHRQLSICLP